MGYVNTDTIAGMIAEVNAAGYFFNNLFQLQDGKWRCNLRSEVMVPSHSEFGTGPDPTTAVAEALRRMQADKPQRRAGADELTELDIPAFLRRHKDGGVVGAPAPAPDLPGETRVAVDDLVGGAAAQADDLVG